MKRALTSVKKKILPTLAATGLIVAASSVAAEEALQVHCDGFNALKPQVFTWKLDEPTAPPPVAEKTEQYWTAQYNPFLYRRYQDSEEGFVMLFTLDRRDLSINVMTKDLSTGESTLR